MNERERRAAVRQRYGERCGYCGVQAAEVGSELELDHFQSRAAGGADSLANLVYCCPACNRLKGDFWPPADPHTATQRLLHPGRDDLAQHLRAEPDGRLTALTHTGAFHIERLRLNRRPLLVLRQARQEVAGVRESLEAARVEQERLRARIAALEQELHDVLTQLARLLAR